jgi:hypothetical protein
MFPLVFARCASLEICMRKTVLPLPESFIVHATALVNHVHAKTAPPPTDHRETALELMLRGDFVVTMADMGAPLPLQPRLDERRV